MDEKLDKVIECYSEMVDDLKTIIYDYINDKFFDDVRNTASFKDTLDGYREELEDRQNLLGWLKELKEMRIKDKESQRPKGKWIKIPIMLCHYPCDGCAKDKGRADNEWCSSCEFWKAEDFDYRCSECGKVYSEVENYCPNCGAEMEVEK